MTTFHLAPDIQTSLPFILMVPLATAAGQAVVGIEHGNKAKSRTQVKFSHGSLLDSKSMQDALWACNNGSQDNRSNSLVGPHRDTSSHVLRIDVLLLVTTSTSPLKTCFCRSIKLLWIRLAILTSHFRSGLFGASSIFIRHTSRLAHSRS